MLEILLTYEHVPLEKIYLQLETRESAVRSTNMFSASKTCVLNAIMKTESSLESFRPRYLKTVRSAPEFGTCSFSVKCFT